MKQLHTFYFSPIGRTSLIANLVAQRLSARLNLKTVTSDYTLPQNRANIQPIKPDEIILWATPVYAGKTPNLMLPFVKKIMRGHNNPVILIATFGNRSYDNALAEMAAVAREGGLRPVAAAAIVTQHAFATDLGKNRPDMQDRQEINLFADHIDLNDEIRFVPGVADAPYYQPLKEDHTPARFLKALPVVDDTKCLRCFHCAELCPVGSIVVKKGDVAGRVSTTTYIQINPPCIKCNACVTNCPAGAISIPDSDFQSHRQMLLTNMTERKDNVFIV